MKIEFNDALTLDDRMVIAPAASVHTKSPSMVNTRNSLAIRAKLRPLLNEERIE